MSNAADLVYSFILYLFIFARTRAKNIQHLYVNVPLKNNFPFQALLPWRNQLNVNFLLSRWKEVLCLLLLDVKLDWWM